MRSIPCVVAVAASLYSAPVSADVSKAWQAAKDNLPAVPAIGAIDVAAIVKLPSFGKLFDLARKEEREIDEVLNVFKTACKIDPLTAVDGIVIAGDPAGRDDDIVVFIQLTLDRAKTSTCIEAAIKSVEKKKPVAIKQDGIYSVVSVGKETGYFAWVGPNVVAFTIDVEKKATIEKNIGKKGLGKAPIAAQLGKLDPKAVAFGAFSFAKPLDSDIPFTTGYGNVTLAGSVLSAAISATATDAKLASAFAAEANKEMAGEMKRTRTPPSAKKIMGTIKIVAKGADVTITGSGADKDLLDAFMATMMKPQKQPAEPPPATTR